MKKIIISVMFSMFLSIVWVHSAEAKLLPRFQNAKPAARTSVSSGLGVSVKLRSDRLALNVNFSNLNKVKGVTYTLMYQSNGIDQGVSGSIDLSAGNSVSRELLFGTCSSGVCRYHTNIINMKLEIVSDLLNGKRTIRRYRIKV
ncbi:MAG: hypothetical protein Q7R95_09200 [bacterium]|nr:hypothetical protein [bacterium]